MYGPDDVVRAFVQNLPATIRETLTAQCCIAFDRFDAKPDFDFAAAFDEILNEGRDSWRAFQVAKLVGVIEVLLVHDEAHRPTFEELAREQPEVEIFARTALQAPMKERHLAAARQTFEELREYALSPYALRQWWHYLQTKDRLR